MTEFEKKCIDVLDALDGQQPLVSCQGQGMDGYSALANFTELTRKLKAAQKNGETEPSASPNTLKSAISLLLVEIAQQLRNEK